MLHRCRRTRRIMFSVGLAIALPLVDAPPLSAAAPASSSDAVVKRGDHSLQVVQLQQLLIAAGVTVNGGADGDFGPGTETAVKEYQRQHGLTVNGIADVPTATALGMLSPDPVLAKGASGDSVRRLQQQLIAVGVTVHGGADGQYGDGTKRAVAAFQTSKGLSASGSVDAATAAVLANAAAGAATAPTAGAPVTGALAAFPVPATCQFWDTWLAPRSGGRKHLGVDIAAPKWTPVFAVNDGTISKRQLEKKGSLAGNSVWLTTADGTYYFYAHLASFSDGAGVGSEVNAGDVIGYVGTTGNAIVSHLHFEVHPKGGQAVNPYPIVDAASSC
ncbi:MAG: peptidoglycan-binding protein [Ilumatobacteraceae bacterium]